jgi:hypothetical protein
MTSLWVGQQGFDCHQGPEMSLFTEETRAALGPTKTLRLFPGDYSGLDVKLTTHLYLVLRLE